MGLNRQFVDKKRVKAGFTRALATYDENAHIQRQMSERLLSLMLPYLPKTHLDCILEIGCGTGQFSELLQRHLSAEYWLFNDLCDVEKQLKARLTQPFQFYCGDGENFPQTMPYSLITSSAAVQWFHHPKQFLARCAQSLKNEGILAFSTFDEQNLAEIRQLTGQGLSYPGQQQWREWLAADFELLECACEPLELWLDSPLAVLKHCRDTGVNGLDGTPWTKGKLAEFNQAYQQAFSAGDKVRLIYTPIYIVAKLKGKA